MSDENAKGFLPSAMPVMRTRAAKTAAVLIGEVFVLNADLDDRREDTDVES